MKILLVKPPLNHDVGDLRYDTFKEAVDKYVAHLDRVELVIPQSSGLLKNWASVWAGTFNQAFTVQYSPKPAHILRGVKAVIVFLNKKPDSYYKDNPEKRTTEVMKLAVKRGLKIKRVRYEPIEVTSAGNHSGRGRAGGKSGKK